VAEIDSFVDNEPEDGVAIRISCVSLNQPRECWTKEMLLQEKKFLEEFAEMESRWQENEWKNAE
jgi:hypothetical protein